MSNRENRRRLRRAKQFQLYKNHNIEENMKSINIGSDNLLRIIISAFLKAYSSSYTWLAQYRHSKRRHEHEDAESEALETNKILADWTKILALVGVFGIAVSIKTLFAVQGQLQAMKEDQKPWVSFLSASFSSDLVFPKEGGAAVVITFAVTNTGHSPAMHVVMRQKFFARSSFGAREMSQVNEVCNSERIVLNDTYGEGYTIFPGQTFQYPYHLLMSKSDVKRLKDIVPTAAMVAGCVEYSFPNETAVHRTYFAAEVDKTGGAPNTFLKVPLDQPTVPAQSLTLASNPMLEGNAN